MIRLESVCRRPFNEAVFEACSAITTCGGWIKDHRLYSNMMAMIAFEVPAGGSRPWQPHSPTPGSSSRRARLQNRAARPTWPAN